MNVNIHTFTNGEALFWNLGLVRVVGSMPAESCIELLKKKLSEYDLILDDDIAAITSDGASVMVKVGRLIKPLQQLCYAHGIQLGVIDVIYKKKENNDPEDNLQNDNVGTRQANDEENELLDIDEETEDINESEGFDCILPTVEVHLVPEYDDLIRKVRKTVKLFRKSPTKNDVLQKYISNEFGKNMQLVLDCKTRWSSLADMISRFNKLKTCVSKAFIDVNLGTNPNYAFSEEEYVALVELEHVFQPIKLAVEVLCRRDSDLITAETTLRFMVRKLENLTTPIAQKLADAMRTRIRERRTIMTAALFYLRDSAQYDEDFKSLVNDNTFSLPPKTLVKKEIKRLIERLYVQNQSSSSTSLDAFVTVVDDDIDDITPLSAAANTTLSLDEELEMILKARPQERPSCATGSLFDKQIRQEINLYESGGAKGHHLQSVYQCLSSVVPTSVEAERAFSAAGYIARNIRSQLADNTLDILCFL